MLEIFQNIWNLCSFFHNRYFPWPSWRLLMCMDFKVFEQRQTYFFDSIFAQTFWSTLIELKIKRVRFELWQKLEESKVNCLLWKNSTSFFQGMRKCIANHAPMSTPLALLEIYYCQVGIFKLHQPSQFSAFLLKRQSEIQACSLCQAFLQHQVWFLKGRILCPRKMRSQWLGKGQYH